MLKLIQREYYGAITNFTDDGWFNATEVAAQFGKEASDWLRQRDTAEYVSALASFRDGSGFLPEFCKITELDGSSAASRSKLLKLVKSTGFARTKAGSLANGGGTWLHPKLAVAFARWLDVKFGIWCDMQIDDILRGKLDHKKLRHEAASGSKVMSGILQLVRSEIGKATKDHHYSNEHRLVNWALSGKFEGLDRDSLSEKELDVLAKLQAKNSVLIGRGVEYAVRKKIMEQYAIDLRDHLSLAA